MIKSMTGYGRGESVSEIGKITVEIKAVNHRYLDLNIKMPRQFNPVENEIRLLLKQQIGRGKVDVFVTYEAAEGSETAVNYNETLAAQYVAHCLKISETFQLKNDLSASVVARFPEVLSMAHQEQNVEALDAHLMEALKIALAQFMEARVLEGAQLKNDLIAKLEFMGTIADAMEERYPLVLTEYREKLLNKVRDLLETTNIDEARVATEVILYADKICIDEELVRLRSHILQTKEVLENMDQVGRKLDFLAQELNREANTMLSKTNDMKMTDLAIELKTEIEKVREQIQNLE